MKTNYFKIQTEDISMPEKKDIEMIVDHIVDKKSLDIFNNALQYSITGEMKYVRELVLSNCEGEKFYSRLKNESKPILIYGAGQRGKQLVELYPDIKWTGFIDKRKTSELVGYPTFQMDGIQKKCMNAIVVISPLLDTDTIVNELVNVGIDYNNLIILEDYNKKLQEKQYVTSEFINYRNIKQMFDIGGYDGLDTIKFLTMGADKVYLLEPDEIMYEKCLKIFEKNPKVCLLKKGASDKEAVIQFMLKEGGLSSAAEVGNTTIETICLDTITDGKIDFIKMDIEGEEARALEGAKNIICRSKPEMAISVYHRREDIWKIPLQILNYNPKYKFEFKHYSMNQVDTVMYVHGGK